MKKLVEGNRTLSKKCYVCNKRRVIGEQFVSDKFPGMEMEMCARCRNYRSEYARKKRIMARPFNTLGKYY